MTMSMRTFGVEIECFGGNRQYGYYGNTQRHGGLHSALCAADVTVFSHYNTSNQYNRRGGWVMKGDGSIRPGHGTGLEIISPILRGEDGLESVLKVCRALKAQGYRINNSCGLHVHVGARDFTAPEIYSVVKRYADNEATINKFVKKYRRNSQWCRSAKPAERALTSAISRGCETLNRVRNVTSMVGTHSGRGRVNCLSMSRLGTIEFRQHHASIAGKEITNWIQFLVNFMEVSKDLAPTVTQAGQLSRRQPRNTDSGPLMGLPSPVKRWLKSQSKKFGLKPIKRAYWVNDEGYTWATWNRAGTALVRCREERATYAIRDDGTRMPLREIYGCGS